LTGLTDFFGVLLISLYFFLDGVGVSSSDDRSITCVLRFMDLAEVGLDFRVGIVGDIAGSGMDSQLTAHKFLQVKMLSREASTPTKKIQLI
jgi:hypothetical protein